MCQALTCGRVLARARVQVLQNSGSQMVVLRFTTLSAWDSHLQNARKKNYRELSNIKSTLVSALTGSVPRKIAEAWQEFQLSSGIEPKLPDSLRITLITEPKVRINWPKKTVYDSLFLATWNRFFCVQDCRSRIVQVEYQDQTRYTRILESWDRSSISSHGWLVSNTVDECLQRQIAQKIFKLKIEACPVNAGHYMAFQVQTLHFICYRFGHKLWWLLIQNHAWVLSRPDVASKLLPASIWSSCAV